MQRTVRALIRGIVALLCALAACGLQSGGLAGGDVADVPVEVGDGDAVRPDDGATETPVDAVSDGPASCGDGVREGDEECDDGDPDDTDECPTSCRWAFCGDGFLRAGLEQCDDGAGNSNTASDACRLDCSPSRCGDGVSDTGEACDDGNTDDADGCRNDCRLPGCGNGRVDPGEACDDGNADNTDDCLETCVSASCGDGYVRTGSEECDGAWSSCTTTCGSIGRRDCLDCAWATGCTAPVEWCNGADDDCDGSIDDGFACRAGASVPCTTTCGSTGIGPCGADCLLPAPGACLVPPETCNGVDDDCDTTTDEGCGTVPPNDTCATAATLLPGTTTGDTTRASDNATPTCSGSGGRDVWYSFSLPERRIVYLDTVDGAAWSTVLEVRRGACPGAAVSGACNDDACGGDRSQVVLTLDPGTYTVLVDGHDASHGGTFGLFFQTAACPVPRIATNGNTDGNTAGRGNSLAGSCGGTRADEDAWYFALCRPTAVTAHTCSATTVFDTIVYFRSGDCWDASPEPACNDDGPSCPAAPRSSRVTATLPKGLSFVVIDGYDGAEGAYRLNVSGLP